MSGHPRVSNLKLGNLRLLKLARILRRAHRRYTKLGILNPTTACNIGRGYWQTAYTHTCGTPACALGHWAAEYPKQWMVDLGRAEWSIPGMKGVLEDGRFTFCLNIHERYALFGPAGCGGAQTALEAAKYIEEFVAHRRTTNHHIFAKAARGLE